MNKEDRSLIDLLIRELQYRNYSPGTVVSYSQIMVNLTKKIDIPLATITTQQFKDYLHGRIFRFMQHVIPTGFYKIRYFGFMALCNSKTKQKNTHSIHPQA